MAFFERIRFKRNPDGARIVFLLSALYGCAVFATVAAHVKNVSGVALIYEAICRELMNSSVEGRQALIGSVWWPPLPALLRIPFVAFPVAGVRPFASLAVSALLGAGALYVFERALRDCKLGWARFPMVLALAANPFFIDASGNGTSQTTVIFFALLVAHSLLQWIMFRKLRFLAHLGVGSALLLVSSCEMSMWVAVVFLLLLTDMISSNENREDLDAVLILTLLPTVYIFALWILSNWLVMGDALYFTHSFVPLFRNSVAHCGTATRISSAHYLTSWTAVVALVVSIARKNRDGIFIGILGIVPMLLGLFLASRGVLRPSSPILYCLYPLTILAVVYSAEKQGPDLHLPETGLAPLIWPYLLSLVPIVLTAIMILMPNPWGAVSKESEEEVANVSENHSELLAAVGRDVRMRSPHSKIYICGYDSLIMVGPDTNSLFLRSLDLNFNKAKSDYPGYALYVLIHRPEGRSAMESIHWKYDGIYDLGAPGILYDSDYGDWRLFEIIQPDGSDRI
jgi:hypothetical protein